MPASPAKTRCRLRDVYGRYKRGRPESERGRRVNRSSVRPPSRPRSRGQRVLASASRQHPSRTHGPGSGPPRARLAEVLEHLDGRQDQRQRVGPVRRRPPRASPRRSPRRPARRPRAGSPAVLAMPPTSPAPRSLEQVAVQVAGRQHLELVRPADQLHARVIDDQFLRRDVGEVLRHPPEAVEEQPVGQLQDVRLVDAVDRLAALSHGQLEREPEEPQARGLGDDLEALHHARARSRARWWRTGPR